MLVQLAGCTTSPKLPDVELERLWQQHRQSLVEQTEWTLAARVAGHSEDDGWSGKITWVQGDADFQIHFQAPFGQGAVQLTGGPEQVEMRISDGQVFVAEDAESLLFRQLGWHMPLKGLRYWVLGLPMPTPGAANTYESSNIDDEVELTFDDVGRLARLRQAQWQVDYSGYRSVDGLMLPKKVYLENDTFSLRLVIDRWQFPKPNFLNRTYHTSKPVDD